MVLNKMVRSLFFDKIISQKHKISKWKISIIMEGILTVLTCVLHLRYLHLLNSASKLFVLSEVLNNMTRFKRIVLPDLNQSSAINKFSEKTILFSKNKLIKIMNTFKHALLIYLYASCSSNDIYYKAIIFRKIMSSFVFLFRYFTIHPYINETFFISVKLFDNAKNFHLLGQHLIYFLLIFPSYGENFLFLPFFIFPQVISSLFVVSMHEKIDVGLSFFLIYLENISISNTIFLPGLLGFFLSPSTIDWNDIFSYKSTLILGQKIISLIKPCTFYSSLSFVVDLCVAAGDASLKGFNYQVNIFISRKPKLIKIKAKSVISFLIKILDLRNKRPPLIYDLAFIEIMNSNIFIFLISKLTEFKTKVIMICIRKWVSIFIKDLRAYLARLQVFHNIITTLLYKYRTNFIKYFKFFLSECVFLFGKSKPISIKKGVRKFKKIILNTTFEYPCNEDKWLLRQQIIRVVSMCLHLTPVFTSRTNYNVIQKHVIFQNSQTPGDKLESYILRDCVMCTSKKFSDLDTYGMEIVDAIVRMVQPIYKQGPSAHLIYMNHQVLSLLSHSSRGKLISIEFIKSMAILMKEDFSLLLTENLACLFELRDTSLDPHVLHKSQEAIGIIEKLTGV